MHNPQPLVSVIMNCFNGSRYLKQAVDSVLSQTYTNWELIFWDNNSLDSSLSMMQNLASIEQRIRVFSNSEHTVLGTARRLAIDKANGEWIAFLDTDDIWQKNKLEKQINFILESTENIGLIYSNAEIIYTNSPNVQSGLSKQSDRMLNPIFLRGNADATAFKCMQFECFVPLPTAMVKREFYYNVGGINAHFEVAEDYDLFLKISKFYYIDYISEVLSKYRIHNSNLSNKKYWQIYEESILLVTNMARSWKIISHLALLSWKGKYILASLRYRDWKRFLYLLFRPNFTLGLIIYLILIRPIIYILRRFN